MITKLVEAPWAYIIRVYVDRKLGSSTWLRLRHLHTNRSDQFNTHDKRILTRRDNNDGEKLDYKETTRGNEMVI